MHGPNGIYGECLCVYERERLYVSVCVWITRTLLWISIKMKTSRGFFSKWKNALELFQLLLLLCVCVCARIFFLCAIFIEFEREVNGTNRADISDDYDRPLSKQFASNLLLIDDDCKFMHCIRMSIAFHLDCFDMAHCSANAIYDRQMKFKWVWSSSMELNRMNMTIYLKLISIPFAFDFQIALSFSFSIFFYHRFNWIFSLSNKIWMIDWNWNNIGNSNFEYEKRELSFKFGSKLLIQRMI